SGRAYASAGSHFAVTISSECGLINDLKSVAPVAPELPAEAESGSGTVKSRSYNRTSASKACAALTQWIVPLTLRLEVAPPDLLSRSTLHRSSVTLPALSLITSSHLMM